MNKQDKIKKVMREIKNGKLKTPNCEVVNDKKQAFANILPPKGYIDNTNLL